MSEDIFIGNNYNMASNELSVEELTESNLEDYRRKSLWRDFDNEI